MIASKQTLRILAALVALALAILCAVSLASGLQPERAWAAEGDEPCGYAYLEPYAGKDWQYTLYIEKEQRDDAGKFKYLGSVRAGGYDDASQKAPWCVSDYAAYIEEAVVRGGVRPTSTSCWFEGCSQMKAVDFGGLDLSATTDMSKMFFGCGSLASFDFSKLDGSPVRDVSRMFRGSGIESVACENLSMPQVETAEGMFLYCTSLKAVDLPGLNLPKATNVRSLFEGCTNLASADLSDMALPAGADMTNLFYVCENLTAVDLFQGASSTRPKLPEGANLSFMFYGCKSLESFDLSVLDGAPVGNVSDMFRGCSALEKLDYKNLNLSSATSVEWMFADCSSLQAINLPGLNLSSATSLTEMFGGCSSVSSVNLSRLQAANATGVGGMLQGCPALTVDFSNADLSKVTYASGLLSDCKNLSVADLSGINLSSAALVGWMFSGSLNTLKAVDLSGADFSSAHDLNGLFKSYPYQGRDLQRVNLSGLKAGGATVTSLSLMFEDCGSLEEVNLAGLEMPNVTDVSGMFKGCATLKSVDFTGVSMSSVTDASSMFMGCRSLTSVKMKAGGLPAVWDASSMFSGCTSLESMDLGFLPSTPVSATALFNQCYALKSVSFPTSESSPAQPTVALTSQRMFSGCTSLAEVDLRSVAIAEPDGQDMFKDCVRLQKVVLPSSLEASAPLVSLYTLADHWNADGQGTSQTCSSAEEMAAYLANASGAVQFTAGQIEGCTYAYADEAGTALTLRSEPLAGKAARLLGVIVSGSDTVPWVSLGETLEEVSIEQGCKAWSTREWFKGFASLKSVEGLGNLDTSSVADASSMFSGCTSLTSVDLAEADFSNAVDMGGMFENCVKLPVVDLHGHAPAKVQKMGRMFYNSGVTSVNLAGSDLSKVTDTDAAFSFSEKHALDLSRVCLPSADRAVDLFVNCSSLSLAGADFSRVSSAARLFFGCVDMESIDLTDVDLSHVTDMSEMFVGCSALTNLDLSSFKTSGVTTMKGMFRSCSSLASLDLSKLDTSSVTDLSYLLDGCKALSSVNLANLDTSSATDMSSMFRNCSSLASLDLQRLDMSKVEDASYLLSGCAALSSVSLDGLDVARVKSMSNMFSGCAALKSVDLSKLKALQATDLSEMFKGCSALQSVTLSGFEAPVATDASGMFSGCSSLESVSLAGFGASNLETMAYLFQSCSKLVRVDFGGIDTRRVTDLSYMFERCTSLASLDFLTLDTSAVTTMRNMFSNCALTSASFPALDTRKVTDMRDMFLFCEGLTVLDFSNLDLSAVSQVDAMLYGCRNFGLITVPATLGVIPALPEGMWKSSADEVSYRSDQIPVNVAACYTYQRSGLESYAVLHADGELVISSSSSALGAGRDDDRPYSLTRDQCSSAQDVPWHDCAADILKVTIIDAEWVHAAHWFEGCPNLKSVSVSGTFMPLSIDSMFSGCTSLVSVDLTGIDLWACSVWFEMFRDCTSLETIDLSSFGRKQPYNVSGMFSGCASLVSVDLSQLDTSYVRDYSEMFRDCASLASLDLSSFNTRRATDMRRMFHGCDSLAEVRLGADFTFRGAAWSRLPGSELPAGAWRPQAQDDPGKEVAYAGDSLPSFVAETYKRVEEAPGLTVVSLRGDTADGAAKYTIKTNLVQGGAPGELEEVSDYVLADEYALDTFTVGESAKASSVKTLTASTVTSKTVGSVVMGANSPVHAVILGTQVGKVKSRAFAGSPSVSLVTVKSAKLAKKSKMNNCLSGSKVRKVVVSISSASARSKVATAFRSWSGLKAK